MPLTDNSLGQQHLQQLVPEEFQCVGIIIWSDLEVLLLVKSAIGSLYNCLVPSLILGCGARGDNSCSENVGYKNLLNIKKVASREKAAA